MEAFVRRLQHWMLYRAICFAGATTESFEHLSVANRCFGAAETGFPSGARGAIKN